MVQSPKKEIQGIEYGDKKYYSVEEFLTKFKPCPQSLYIRGSIDEDRIAELSDDLKIADKPLTYQVQDEVKYFILSPETVAKWKCGEDVSPNVPYIVNGTTRYTTLKRLEEEKKDANFLPVPTVEVFLDDYSDDTIVYDIQIKSNDTTREHSTVAKYRSIANLLNRKISMGIAPAEARKQCARISGFTPATVSHAEKFLDRDDMPPELLEERKKLFGLLDSGHLSVDSVITIIQIVDKLEENIPGLTYSQILNDLQEIYPVVIKPGQTIFSRNQIANYKKQLEKQVEEQKRESANNGTQTTEDNNEKEDTEESTSEASAPVNKEEVEAAKSTIEIIVHEIQKEPSDDAEIENIDNYRQSTLKLLKVAGKVIKYSKPQQYKALYDQLSRVVSEVLSDTDVKLEDKDLITVSKGLEEVRNILTQPAKNTKAQEELEPIEAEDPKFAQPEIPFG